MKDIIQLLPDSVANQIAAGEVVQRPASVVKELMENSVDAGATKIQVFVADGGRTLVQVIDNGKGMSETDARLAFERHATSKIKSADDLFSLTTMGFRGEALASIVAVAQVELVTKREEDELGTQIMLSGSKLELQEPVMAPVGSNFKVKNLFYNIPARRKFLKSTQTELNNIVTEFERVALINCNVEFSFSHNGSEIIHLQPSSFRQRIVNLFGKKINQQLLEVEVASPLIDIKGFVGTPESARKKGALQYFFVNGRYMRHPYFAKAVNGAFEDIIPQGEQVSFFLCINVDSSRIDVNIHPTKTEIKFEDEPSLWKIISAAVRESLGRFNAAPSLDFDDENMPDLPVMNVVCGTDDAPVSAPRLSYTPGYNPFKKHLPDYRGNSNAEMEMLYGCLDGEKAIDLSPFEDLPMDGQDSSSGDMFEEKQVAEEYLPLSQYKGQYILIPVKSGLMWVHQRRAHIKVLFEEYKSQMQEKHAASQGLLFPERIEATVNESVTIENIQEELSCLGFDISSLGGGTYAINGAPAGIAGLDPSRLLMDIVHDVMDRTGNIKSRIDDTIALAMAKEIAVVTGQVLTQDEMNALISKLFQTSTPALAPDGNLIIYILPDQDIERYFSK